MAAVICRRDAVVILCEKDMLGGVTTRRISISVPQDVAERLDREENASSYIAGAVRARMRREAARDVLTAAGFAITTEGVDRMRQRVLDLERRRAKHSSAA
jgi:hypothetical protein